MVTDRPPHRRDVLLQGRPRQELGRQLRAQRHPRRRQHPAHGSGRGSGGHVRLRPGHPLGHRHGQHHPGHRPRQLPERTGLRQGRGHRLPRFSWLTDPDGDGIATFTTTDLPAGTYRARPALGLPAVADGAPATFTVAADGAATTFSHSASSKVLDVYPGQAKPSLAPRSAYWLAPDLIAWGLGTRPQQSTYQLAAAPEGGLAAGGTGITGGTVIPLTRDPQGLPQNVREQYPHLSGLGALRVPAEWAGKTRDLLKGQVAVAALDTEGNLTTATGLQTQGVLDALYANRATKAELGPVFHDARPTLSLWAPTATGVSVELYDSATSTAPRTVKLALDPRSGVWSVRGDRSWKGLYYHYQVTVWAPSLHKVVTNQVTDPYSLSLSADSRRSQIVDLTDRATAPQGWAGTRSPKAPGPEREQIQEIHVP
ncbi:hypothetical protein RB201_28185 [Streptomyces sp. S1A(2023)]